MISFNSLGIALSLAALLSGCAANYKPIEGRPTAELRFSTKTVMPADVVGLWTVKYDKCPKAEKKMLLTGKETSDQPKLVTIEAGQPFLVQAEHVSMWLGKTCNVGAVFTPSAGYTYNLRSTLTAQGCSLEMMRVAGKLLSFEPTFHIYPSLPDDQLCSAMK